MKDDLCHQVDQVLVELAATDEEPLASLADCLRSAAGTVNPTGDPLGKRAAERISVLVETYVAASGGPGPLVEALQRIDIALATAQVAIVPWATRFTSLAAERFTHALQEHWEANQQKLLAESSPVFQGDGDVLYAVPVGNLKTEGQARFCDRVIAATNRVRPRIVGLHLAYFNPRSDAEKLWDDLAADLAVQGIKLQRR